MLFPADGANNRTVGRSVSSAYLQGDVLVYLQISYRPKACNSCVVAFETVAEFFSAAPPAILKFSEVATIVLLMNAYPLVRLSAKLPRYPHLHQLAESLPSDCQLPIHSWRKPADHL